MESLVMVGGTGGVCQMIARWSGRWSASVMADRVGWVCQMVTVDVGAPGLYRDASSFRTVEFWYLVIHSWGM
jgi:hypothetical protein